jgi:hypothetical protein
MVMINLNTIFNNTKYNIKAIVEHDPTLGYYIQEILEWNGNKGDNWIIKSYFSSNDIKNQIANNGKTK